MTYLPNNPPASHSQLLDLIYATADLPFSQWTGQLITNTATTFKSAISQDPSTRFAAIVVATIITAGSIWGLRTCLGNVPIRFVRKALIPTAECAIKAGLAWVVFQACNASVNGVNEAIDSEKFDDYHKTPLPPYKY